MRQVKAFKTYNAHLFNTLKEECLGSDSKQVNLFLNGRQAHGTCRNVSSTFLCSYVFKSPTLDGSGHEKRQHWLNSTMNCDTWFFQSINEAV